MTISLDAFVVLDSKDRHFVVDDGYLRHHGIIPKDFELRPKPPEFQSYTAHVEYKHGLVLEAQNGRLVMRTRAQNKNDRQLDAQTSQLQQIAQKYVHHFKHMSFRAANGFQFAREGLEYNKFIKNFAPLAPMAKFDDTEGNLHSVVCGYNWKGKSVYVEIKPTSSQEHEPKNGHKAQPINIPFVRVQFQYPEEYGPSETIAQELTTNYKQAKNFVDQLK